MRFRRAKEYGVGVSTSSKAKPAQKESKKPRYSNRPKQGSGTAGDNLLRRFVLTATQPNEALQEVGRFRTKADAVAAFASLEQQGATGQVRSICGPRSVVDLPIDPSVESTKKKVPKKRPAGPVKAPRVSQGEVGAEIMVTAWGETKNLYDWANDPRSNAGYQTIRGRLTRVKPWKPERAISTPPSDNPLKAYNLENAPRYEAFGEYKTVNEWLADPRCQASPNAFRRKLKQGVPTYLALQSRTPSYWRKTGKDFEAFGERKSLMQWADDPRCKVSYHLLKRRVEEEGVPFERAIEGHDPRGLEAFGETQTLRQWSKDPRCSVSYQTLRKRLEAGLSLERAMGESRIAAEERRLQAFGESKTLADWLRDPRCAVTRQTLAQRLQDGVPMEEALTEGTVGRKVSRYEAFGEAKTISKWMDDPRCHASYSTVLARLDAGVPFELAIGRLVSTRAGSELGAFGETKAVDAWAKDGRCAVPRATLVTRLRAGMPLEQALTQPETLGRERLDVPRFVAAASRALAAAIEATDDARLDASLEEVGRLVAEAMAIRRGDHTPSLTKRSS